MIYLDRCGTQESKYSKYRVIPNGLFTSTFWTRRGFPNLAVFIMSAMQAAEGVNVDNIYHIITQ